MQQSKFFWYAGIIAIIFVVLAFGGAAIVQPFRLERYLKPFVVVHILSSMGWLILFTYQSKLVLSGQLDRHRANLTLATILVLVTVLFALYITYKWGSAERLLGESRDVLGFAILFFFSIRAIKLGNTETHRRLMLIACLNLINPAFVRLGSIFDFSIPIVVGLGILTWVIVPIWHDVYSNRKIHKATIAGIAFTLISFAFVIMIIFSPFMENIKSFLYPNA